MLQTIRIMNGQGAAGAGTIVHEVNGTRLGVYIQTVAAATAKSETSPDGARWLDTSIVGKTANGYFALDEVHRFVRANVTAWTAGSVTVDVVQQV